MLYHLHNWFLLLVLTINTSLSIQKIFSSIEKPDLSLPPNTSKVTDSNSTAYNRAKYSQPDGSARVCYSNLNLI